jgi:ADP-ribose pyrophosphatase YjhB (NUDIX family)
MRAEHPAEGELQGRYREFVPHLSVDCVIFGFHDGELKILLLRWNHAGGWALPGGYVRWSEALDDAADRTLLERTGLERVYLRQFGAFGGLGRGEAAVRRHFEGTGHEVPEGFWPAERVVSIGYYALVDFSEAEPAPDAFAEDCRWWEVSARPPLLFDHEAMVERALEALRREMDRRPPGLNLLPEKFTMSELQRLYETVLGRPLDRRNFQKRMRDLEIVVRLPERKRGGAHRAPYLYRFAAERFEEGKEG